MSIEPRIGSHGQANPQFLYSRPLIWKGGPSQIGVVGQRQSDSLGAQTNGVRPFRQSVSHENVQALHPVRHSATGKGGPQVLNAVADAQVVFVRSLIIGGQDLIGFQPVGHPFHDSGDFESRRLRRQTRIGQVIQRRKRGTVVEPGGRRHDSRLTIGSAICHLEGTAGTSP